MGNYMDNVTQQYLPDRRDFIKTFIKAGTLLAVSPSLFNNKNALNFMNTEPSICIFSKHLEWLDYPQMAKMAADLGFDGIDLTVRPGGHVEPERVKTDLPRAVKTIRDAGLTVPMITTSIIDPEDPLTRNILETAGNLDIPVYRTGWFRYSANTKVSELLDHARQKLRKLQDLNRAYDIRAAYQNHAGNFLGSSGWDLLTIIEDLDPHWIGVQFDISHATVEGPETWPYILELLAPYINTLDIKDFTWKIEKGTAQVIYVPLGEGMVDFERFFELLRRYQIQGDYSLHLEYPLGGAEHGHEELDISKNDFMNHVASDRDFLNRFLK